LLFYDGKAGSIDSYTCSDLNAFGGAGGKGNFKRTEVGFSVDGVDLRFALDNTCNSYNRKKVLSLV
jgi:hypothetical protein